MQLVSRINSARYFWNPKYNEGFYLLPFIFYIIINMILATTIPFPSWMSAVSKVPLILIGLKIVNTRSYTDKEFKQIAFLTVFTLLSWVFSRTNFMVYVWFFIVGAKDVSASKIIKYGCCASASIIVIGMILSITGVIENVTVGRPGTKLVRYSFGIKYPTDFASHLMYLFLFFSILNTSLKKYLYVSIGFILAVFIYIFPNGRLDAILILMITLAFSVLPWLKQNSKWLFRYLVWSWIICFVISMVLILVYDDKNFLTTIANQILSGRMRLGNHALNKYGITLFGQYIFFNGWGDFDASKIYNFVDSAYIQILLQYGIVYVLYIMYLQTQLSQRLYRLGAYKWLLGIMFIALHGIISHHFFNVVHNPLWVCLFAEWSSVNDQVTGAHIEPKKTLLK